MEIYQELHSNVIMEGRKCGAPIQGDGEIAIS